MRIILDGRQAATWTAMPGIITKVNLAENTVEVQLALTQPIRDEAGEIEFVEIKPLQDVPLVFPGGGGFTLTFPITVGDEVLVVFASRCIDSWWQSGGTQKPMEPRMHDLSDAFAIPGPRSQPEKISSISSTKVQLRNDAGTSFVEIDATGKITVKKGTTYFSVDSKFAMKNAAADLKGVITDLKTAVNTFMAAMAALAGGAAPATQVMLQAPGAAAVASLALVTVKIEALLDAS